MRTTYDEADDILVVHSDKAIARKALQDWNTHISYAEDGPSRNRDPESFQAGRMAFVA